MALLSLIFRKPQKAQIGVMQLDASISENHQLTGSVTQNPIEDGSNISDHITLEPTRLSLTGMVSDTPLTLRSSLIGAGVGAVTDVVSDSLGGIAGSAAAAGVGSVAGLVAPSDDESKKSTNDAYRYLEELFKNRVPFTVITKLKKYDNMVISSLNIPRDASIGASLRFVLELEQVQIVRSSSVKIPAFQVQTGSKARGQGTTNVGKQSAKEVEEGTSTYDKGKTFAANLLDGNLNFENVQKTLLGGGV